jgi:Uma2 family endonuclease
VSSEAYVIDPDDPRAPTEAQWAAMSEAERERVAATLPADMPWELHPPEGDSHREPKDMARDALGEFFRRKGRRVYVSSELVTYYPGERRFCPDVLAVVDVEPHKRESWIVNREGKGLDFVLEVHVSGDDRKDFEHNVERYARLGIPEYFAFDRPRARLWGWRLRNGASSYERIVPQAGRLASQVLGLALTVEGERVRFYDCSAPLLFVDEIVGRLESMVDELIDARDAAIRRAEEQAQRAQDLEREVERLREELARRGR